MTHADLPTYFLREAFSTVAYILNNSETKVKPFTPFEIWTRQKLDLNKPKVCGCKAHVLILRLLRNRLESKT